MKCTRCGKEYEFGFNGNPFKHVAHCANCKFQLEQLELSKKIPNSQPIQHTDSSDGLLGLFVLFVIAGLLIKFWPIVLAIGLLVLLVIIGVAVYSAITSN